MAKKCDTKKGYIWELENNKSQPSAILLYKLSKALKMPMEDFFIDKTFEIELTVKIKAKINAKNSKAAFVQLNDQINNLCDDDFIISDPKNIIIIEK